MTKNVVNFPDHRMIKDEAEKWLIRMDGDTPLSAKERDALNEWLHRSPAHQEEMWSLAQFWERQNILTELAVPLTRPLVRPNRFFPQHRGLRILAAAALVSVIGIGFMLTGRFHADPLTETNGLYATVVGKQMEITLADKSVVHLNTNTQIKVDYSDNYRNIWLLQGEAYFAVANNSKQPFRVYAGNGRVQAVGTAFSVYLKDTFVDVTVTEGKVSLATINRPTRSAQAPFDYRGTDADTSLASVGNIDADYIETNKTLSAGQSITIQRLTTAGPELDEIVTVESSELAKRQSWLEGALTFAGDPLYAVVDEISRYTTLSIEISDPAVRATRIGGRFPVGETDAMFDALETNFGLRVTRVGKDRVLLSAASEQ